MRLPYARESGSQLYEFALILPLLSMILVGMFFGGILLYDYVTLADAVAAGARTLATNRGAGSGGGPTACDLATSMVESTTNTIDPQQQNLVTPLTFAFTGTSTCSTLVQGDWATLKAYYHCSVPIPFTGVNLCSAQGITSSTTMRIE